MPSADALTPFLFEHAAVRGALVRVDATVAAVLAAHDYPPAVGEVLSELVAAVTLLAASLKFKGSLIVQLQGDGPVRLMVVECTDALGVRATAQWDAARVAFACSCTQDRVENALRIAGAGEVESILAERGNVEVTCEFCQRKYTLEPTAARALFAGPTRH